MKGIKLLEAEGVPSREMLEVALSNHPMSLRGLVNIQRALKLLDKIAAANGTLQLEDAEFDQLFRAVDEMQWAPPALKMKAFFEEMQRAKAGSAKK